MENISLNDKQRMILGLAKKGVISPSSKEDVSRLIIECFKASAAEGQGGGGEALKCYGLTLHDYNIIANYVKGYLAMRGDLYVSKIRENILRQDFFASTALEYTFVTGKKEAALLDSVLWFLCESGEVSKAGSVISLTASNGDLNADNQ